MPRTASISAHQTPGTSAKKRAVAISLLAAVVMTFLKLWAGLVSGSIGVLSEAVHSGLDLVASGITLISVTLSDRPADETHAYGHGKMENLAAFTEALLMMASILWILIEAIKRMSSHASPLRLSIWPFAVLLLSIAVDSVRSRKLGRVARQTGSQALEADALNYSMDVWSSLAVIAGLLASAAAQYWHVRWLRLGDPVSAIVVSAIILKACWKLVWQTVDVLTDAAPVEKRRQVTDVLRQMPNLLGIERVRIRRSGSRYFADITVGMPRNLSFQRTELIKEEVADVVHRVLPDADVIVNVIPRIGSSESIFDRVRAVVARHNLSVHDLSVQHSDGRLHLEQHLEVPESLNLRQAHTLVTKIENETRADVPEIDTILTHIENESDTIESEARRRQDDAVEAELRRIAAGFPNVLDVHDVVVSNTHDRMQISCHCTMPDDLSMADVHALITALEDRVKAEMPQIARVLIHPEPATDNER